MTMTMTPANRLLAEHIGTDTHTIDPTRTRPLDDGKAIAGKVESRAGVGDA